MDPLEDPLRPNASPTGTATGRARRGLQLWRWVPIRVLKARHRPRIEQHLLGLSERDRYLRFGYQASDERISAYVRSLDFRRDEIFGIYNRRLQLVAMAHLAYAPPEGSGPRLTEFAVSVLPYTRGRGYGARLFDHAVMHARNRHIERLMIHALTENTAMLRIAHNAGAVVEHDGVDSEAWLTLPPDTFGSQVEELVSTHAAELSYGLRYRRRQVARMLTLGGLLRRRTSQL